MTDTPQPASSFGTSTARTILVSAAVFRLIAVALILTRFPTGWFFTHGLEMGLLARHLLEGTGLSSPFGPSTGPTAFIAPGYPLFVAAVFKLFGIQTQASAAVILLLQTAANVLTIAILMHLARRLFSEQAAIITGLIWMLSPPLVMLPSIFWDTTFSIALLTGLLVLVLHWQTKPTPTIWLGLGAYCAITALLNPAMIFTLFAILAWMAWQTRSISKTQPLLALVAFAIVFSPWPIRNARVFHAFIPLRTTVGEELWMGNHEGATGYLMESTFPTYNQDELNDYLRMGEVAYTQNKSTLAKQYIAANPGIFLRLTARRILRFWTGSGTEHGSPLFILDASITTLLGFLGIILLLRVRRYALASLFTLPMLLFPAPYYLTHAEFRYRLELDCIMTLLAAYAITWLLTERNPAKLSENHEAS